MTARVRVIDQKYLGEKLRGNLSKLRARWSTTLFVIRVKGAKSDTMQPEYILLVCLPSELKPQLRYLLF